MVKASAPGKMILFGEHAVVFGKPAIAIALDLRTTVECQPASASTVNGERLDARRHSYLKRAIELCGYEQGAAIETRSQLPSGSGLGSSAAITVAVIGSILGLQSKVEPAEVARLAFETELSVQGRASPIDTSTSTHGAGIRILQHQDRGLLWSIEKGERKWFIHHCDVPKDLKFVIGYTGIRAPTGPLVAKVKRFVDRSTFARDVIEEMGVLADEGAAALASGDVVRVGELMTRNHRLLAILGVSHPALDRLVAAVSKESFGAKLTGAGGGGCMVALTDRPESAGEAIRRAGGVPIKACVADRGLVVTGIFSRPVA